MLTEIGFMRSTKTLLQTNIKKILLIGAFSQSPDHYTYATSFVAPLTKLGFIVYPFNYRRSFVPCISSQKALQSRLLASLNKKLCNKALLATALHYKPDLIFIIKGEEIKSSTLAAIKQKINCHIVNFYPDNPFTLWNGNSNAQVLKSLPLYSCFLSWSPILTPALACSGCKHTCSFPFAYDANFIYAQAKPANQYLYDICFVGTWEPDREKWLTHVHHALPEARLAIFGNRWNFLPKDSILIKAVKGEAMYGQKMLEIFSSSKIILNFIRQQNYGAHNMRTFEVPASNNFLLTERTPQQAQVFFKEDESIACFSTPQELVEKINFYINHEAKRDAITKKGYEIAQQYNLENQLAHYFSSCPALQKKEIYE